MNPITIEGGDPLWEDNRVPRLYQVWSRQTFLWMMILTSRISSAKIRRTNWKVITTRQIEQILYGCRILDYCWSWTVFSWRKTLNNSHNSQIQWPVVSTTLPRDADASESKGWIRRNTKIGPVLEVTPCCLQGKYGVELRIKSAHKDNSHSCMGQNFSWLEQVGHKLEQQRAGNLRNAVRRTCVKIECRWFCNPIKGQSKTTKTRFCQLIQKNYTYWAKTWTIEAQKYSLSDYPVSMEAYLEKMMERLNSDHQKHFLYCHHWSDEKWKSRMASGGGGQKKRFQYCSDSSGAILYLRALQGHSGRSLIDPTLQDNVIFLDELVENIYHVGCAINLHSIINSGLIPGGQNLSNRQTVFFLPVDPMDKIIRILIRSTWMHRVMRNTCTKHGRNIKNTVYWVDINLAQKKGLKFYQTRPNAIILYDTLPAYCISKVVVMDTRCGRTIEFLIRAKCDQNRSAFGLWWSGSQRSPIAAIWRTNWKVTTTRQIEQILYGCRISECCWEWTVFHDERHWRILTIHRFSGLWWVHLSKRRKIIWTARLDQRNTQIGPVLEVTTSYLQGKYGVEIRIKSVNKDISLSWVRIFSWLE